MNKKRVRVLREEAAGEGPITYWMSRDQRVEDNWALLHAQQLALSRKAPLFVVFCLVPAFLNATRSSRVVATGFSETMWIPFAAAALDASTLRK